MNHAKKLINLLSKNNLTIGSVESLTAGLFIASLANIPGASKVIKGGLITYQSSFKTSLLGIKKSYIDKYGVVSKEVAMMMAKEGKKILNTDLVISFTGNAGPSKEKGSAEVGRVFIALIANSKKIINFSKVYKGDRNTIRINVVEDAIRLILKNVGSFPQKKVK